MSFIIETLKQLLSVCASFAGLALQIWIVGLIIKGIISFKEKSRGPKNH